MSKSVSQKKGSASGAISPTFPFLPIGLLFMALSLLFSFHPAVIRGWGLNYAGCFQPWASALFYLLLMLFWMPPTNRLIMDRLHGMSRRSLIAFCRRHKYATFALIAVAAGICFRLLEIKYILLGDTNDRVTQVAENIIAPEEFLTMKLLRYAYLFLHEHFEYTSLQTFRLFDYITGGLFIFVSLCIADLVGNTFLKKAAVFVISALSLAALLIFCGYTETYMMPALFLILYLYTSLLYLKGKVRFFVPLFVLLVGVGTHLLLVSMLPSLIFLIYSKELWRYKFFRSKWTMAGLALLSAPLIYMAYLRYGYLMLPLHSDEGRMTMFSVAHFVEFFNSHILGAGIGFLLWIATLIYSLARRIKYDVMLWFLLVASLSILGMMFVFVSVIGSGDWDISSFAAIVINLSNAVFLLHLYERRLVCNIKYGILMIAGFSVLHSSAWIFTNKTDASIQWVESAFATDPADYYVVKFGNEARLAVVFFNNGLYERALGWGYKACLKNPNDHRLFYNHALSLYKLGRLQEANALMEESIHVFPNYAQPYSALVSYNSDNPELLLRVLQQFEAVYQKDPKSFASISPKELQYFFDLLGALRAQ
jgi:tetratricopeptide (TPR) repeat protein